MEGAGAARRRLRTISAPVPGALETGTPKGRATTSAFTDSDELRRRSRRVVLDRAADLAQDRADLVAQEDQRDDRDDGDEREDQRVLGEALALLVAAKRREERVDELHGEQLSWMNASPKSRCPHRPARAWRTATGPWYRRSTTTVGRCVQSRRVRSGHGWNAMVVSYPSVQPPLTTK